MSAAKGAAPDLKKYLDKRLALKLNGNRKVIGTMRGFDQFMNIVLDETIEDISPEHQNPLGMVVIRGASVVYMECLDRLS
ncbi:putative small nuclear ribonucleoprotein g [Paratrimastix pyriformis]|uniref:Small nuclear ribonucleoprotein G n=1 Tax=Paratrimastix pyriformis TaxID=342808 RepID=A0ABQ8UKH3_9EUKA|nr:putative small nuclear ribonucleoprotein g [Paratrimastix pyriformis]